MSAARPCILVVDDEADLRALLADYLGPRGLEVRQAADGRAMRAELAGSPCIDLVVLDIAIGAESGLDLLAELRARGDAVPVLMLTGQDGLGQRLAGLRGGADDYLTKPFEPGELLARIRAVLRRAPARRAPDPPTAARPPVRLGRCLLDAAQGRLTSASDGAEIPLTAMELELLRTMLRHPCVALSRERLAELAHGLPPAQGGRGIDAQVMRLRRRLEPHPGCPRVLRTVRGEGYLLEPGDHATAEPSPPAKPAQAAGMGGSAK